MKWAGGDSAERKEFQRDRDDRIVLLVNTYKVVTTELMVALLDLEHTPSNVNIVERRLRILGEEKNFRQVKQEGIMYSVSLSVSLRKTGARAQLIHRQMHSRFWAILFKALPVENYKTDTDLHKEKGPLIPDGYFLAKGETFFLECNTGREHDFEQVFWKANEYYRQRDYLQRIYNIESFRVLWVNRSPERSRHMLKRFAEIGSGGLYLIADEKAIDPFKPETILTCWRSPKTGKYAPLLEG